MDNNQNKTLLEALAFKSFLEKRIEITQNSRDKKVKEVNEKIKKSTAERAKLFKVKELVIDNVKELTEDVNQTLLSAKGRTRSNQLKALASQKNPQIL